MKPSKKGSGSVSLAHSVVPFRGKRISLQMVFPAHSRKSAQLKAQNLNPCDSLSSKPQRSLLICPTPTTGCVLHTLGSHLTSLLHTTSATANTRGRQMTTWPPARLLTASAWITHHTVKYDQTTTAKKNLSARRGLQYAFCNHAFCNQAICLPHPGQCTEHPPRLNSSAITVSVQSLTL